MRPPLTLPKKFALKVLTGYVPLGTAQDLAVMGGSALIFDGSRVLSVEVNGKQVTIQ